MLLDCAQTASGSAVHLRGPAIFNLRVPSWECNTFAQNITVDMSLQSVVWRHKMMTMIAELSCICP